MYNRTLQRVFALLLLVAISFPLISPLLAAPPSESQLPACCRRHGKHHCSMKGMSGAKAASHEVRGIKSKCPIYPDGKSVPVTASLSAGMPAAVLVSPVLSYASPLVQSEAQYRISYARSCQKRGPPSFLS